MFQLLHFCSTNSPVQAPHSLRVKTKPRPWGAASQKLSELTQPIALKSVASLTAMQHSCTLPTHNSDTLLLPIPLRVGKQCSTSDGWKILPWMPPYSAHLPERPCVCRAAKQKKDPLHFLSAWFQMARRQRPFLPSVQGDGMP